MTKRNESKIKLLCESQFYYRNVTTIKGRKLTSTQERNPTATKFQRQNKKYFFSAIYFVKW
jgi:hypothetical protein